MKNIALITNFNIPDKFAAAMRVVDKIEERCEKIFILTTYKDKIMRSLAHRKIFSYETPDTIYRDAELVIVIGGDGYMLESARRAAPSLLMRYTWGVMDSRFCTCAPSTVKVNRMGTDLIRSNPGSSGTESFSFSFSSG